MKLSVATIVAVFVLALALSAPRASAVETKKDVTKSSQIAASNGSAAIQLKDEVKPPKPDKPKKSKGDKDENPDDGNNGGGNDNPPPTPAPPAN